MEAIILVSEFGKFGSECFQSNKKELDENIIE
jgi:hypothetical protein